MARRTFFSFHYDQDIWRANQVRNANVVAGADVAGFFDHSEYEDARSRGPAAIKRMILRHLDGTTVTVVLIGAYTAYRPWVRFEIEESVKRGNGLVGIGINHLWAPPWPGAASWLWGASAAGPVPYVPAPGEMPAYVWNPQNLRGFAQVIEEAAQRGERLRALRAEIQRKAMREFLGRPSGLLPASPGTLKADDIYSRLLRPTPAENPFERLLGRKKMPWEP